MVTTIKKTDTGDEILSWKNIREVASYIEANKRSIITIRPYQDRDAMKIDPSNTVTVYGYRLAWNNILDARFVPMNNGKRSMGFMIVRELIDGSWEEPVEVPVERHRGRSAFQWGGERLMLKDRRWIYLTK